MAVEKPLPRDICRGTKAGTVFEVEAITLQLMKHFVERSMLPPLPKAARPVAEEESRPDDELLRRPRPQHRC